MPSAQSSVQSFTQGTVTGPREKFAPEYHGVTARASPDQIISAMFTMSSESPNVNRNVVSTGARAT